MKYALQKNIIAFPTTGARGTCPNCGAGVVAKCGNIKIWHWAHQGRRHCDVWWENETEWHRQWKNQFPEEWQESICKGDDGEKHIADICTDSGMVVEFQHSYIKPEEMSAREAFYKNMIWVVDGTRFKRDRARFLKYLDAWISSAKGPSKFSNFTEMFPDWVFNRNWVNRSVPVFYDFGETANPRALKNKLWCLLPIGNRSDYIFVNIEKADFVSLVQTGELINYLRQIFRDQLSKDKESEKRREEELKLMLQKDEQLEKERVENTLTELKRLRSKEHALELKQQIYTHPLWDYISAPEQDELVSFPDSLDAEIPDGDWIFGCARQVWQTAVYRRFVHENQKAFTIRFANNWLQENGCIQPPQVYELYLIKKRQPHAIQFKTPTTFKTLTTYCEHLYSMGFLRRSNNYQNEEVWFKVISNTDHTLK